MLPLPLPRFASIHGVPRLIFADVASIYADTASGYASAGSPVPANAASIYAASIYGTVYAASIYGT
eukprot:1192815-Rhodomonas_salina.2